MTRSDEKGLPPEVARPADSLVIGRGLDAQWTDDPAVTDSLMTLTEAKKRGSPII